MAFYLKYRPQTVSELDLASARQGLTGVLQSQQLPHALLFTGPRGTGKTSSARILAKAINCQHSLPPPLAKGGEGGVIPKTKKRKTEKTEERIEKSNVNGQRSNVATAPEPCNHCPACQSITSGQSLDVIEIDAASHRGIDDIRDLREKVRLAPAQLQYKIYIIDEVHMLTTEAFNALLKTLEEPPKNVNFILCTTELHKLPETIVSRCIQIPFPKASIDDIVHSLQRVVAGERLEIEDSALQSIAHHADGSFRDAQKVLEQLSWHSPTGSQKITPDMVNQFIGLSEIETQKIIELLQKQDINQTLQLIEVLVKDGKNLKAIFTQVLENLHQMLLEQIAKGGDSPLFTNTSAEQSRREGGKGGVLEISTLISLIRQLDQALVDMKTATIPQLPLEIAILEWGNMSLRGSPDVTSGRPKQSGSVTNQVPTTPSLSHPNQLTSSPRRDVRAPHNDVAATPAPPPPAPVSISGPFNLQTLQQNWSQLLEAVKPHNHTLQALLRSTKPLFVQADQVTIEVWYPFHLEKLNSYQHREIVINTICQIFKCPPIKLQYVMGQKIPASVPPKTNGNMISETEYTSALKNTSSGSSQVRDRSPQPYSPRRPSSSAARRASTNQVPSSDEDDALIKFAEDLFGG